MKFPKSAEDGTRDPIFSTFEEVLASLEAAEWEVTCGDFWCNVTPAGYTPRPQGWKIHISATPTSAPEALRRVTKVLLFQEIAFKFAKSMHHVHELLDPHAARGSSGKFIAIYPDSDESFMGLALELDRELFGLTGPEILSDRPLRRGSLVHYRYGAFRGHSVMSLDGSFETMLLSPDGELVADQRKAWPVTPAWVRDPLEVETTPASSALILNDRFHITSVIRHANKGGVFRAVDEKTNSAVVVKQARKYVGSTLSGHDVRDGIRNESKVLRTLGPMHITPQFVDFFEQAGDSFLVQEFVSGKTLRDVAREDRHSFTSKLNLALHIANIVSSVHATGMIIRDLSPDNVMVTDSGDMRLIDGECIAPPNAPVPPQHSSGYAAPEQLERSSTESSLGYETDLYALGCMIFFLAAGFDLPPAGTEARRNTLAQAATEIPAVATLTPVIHGLTHEDPRSRWSIVRTQAFLRAVPHARSGRGLQPALAAPLDIDAAISAGLAYLRTSLNSHASTWLWEPGSGGYRYDPRNVEHGAAGVLGVLSLAYSATRDPLLLDTLRIGTEWLTSRAHENQNVIPGLHVGNSGIAWALMDAAIAVEDNRVAEYAACLARETDPVSLLPGVASGTAGAGIAALHFWSKTHDEYFAEQVDKCLTVLESSATRDSGKIFWTAPENAHSKTAGLAHFGFGHGLAGIGYFLLSASRALDGRGLDMAIEVGNTLASQEINSTGCWPKKRWLNGNFAYESTHSWDTGTAGIGRFLIRLWRESGREDFKACADRAAETVYRHRWSAPPGTSRGNSGSGDFLLDMAAATGSREYESMAKDIATAIYCKSSSSNFPGLPVDDSGKSVSASYGHGVAGVVSFLIRLAHQTEPAWMLRCEL